MAEMQHFKDVSYVSANIQVHIGLDRFSQQFAEAQQWLGDRVLECCKPYMPHLTGGLEQRSYVDNGGMQVIFPGPYARFQYGGLVMVDPITGSPWATNTPKVLTDRPLQYSSPTAVDHWFDAMWADNGEVILSGVKQIGGGG